MKLVFPVLILMILCVGLLTSTFNLQPAGAAGPTPLSVSITPHYAVLSGAQSQLFTSSVTGGSLPYTYQWFLFGNAIPGATNPTYNFTAPISAGATYFIWLSVTDNTGTNSSTHFLDSSKAYVWVPAFNAQVYFSMEPVPATPLTNVNASINGLETPPTPSPAGENFTLEIHLRNATATNVPAGVGGIELHFYFGNILNYCKPIGFTDELGQAGGALVGPVIYGFTAGFYDNNFNLIPTAPYGNATQYVVAAASLIGLWNGNDGLVAKITFQIIGQPSQNVGQPDFYTQLQIGYGVVVDNNTNNVPLSVVQGTLRIDSTSASSLVGDLNGDGKVGLDDLVLLALAYGSKPGDSNWNPLADLAPPYGIIGLSDLLTLATHYGQHSP